MDKPFLLIAGDNYYPQSGTEDWKGCFATVEEIKEKIKERKHFRTITKGKNKGEQKYVFSDYEIDGRTYSWYDIVDLRDWTNTRLERIEL